MASRSLGSLTLDLIAKIGGFQQNMNQASQSVAKTGAAAEAASAKVAALEAEFLSLSSIASKVAGPLAAALSVGAIYTATEAYSTLTNRLKLVTDGSTQLATAQAAVFGIAQDSRQPLTATAELYQRIATNQAALKLSGEGVAGVVNTISKTLAISGASAESANAALIQLGQAFASGVLRGEELNSVLEQAPALAQAIANGMGKTVGDLRNLGAQGLLTADAVVKALQSQSSAVETQFSKMTATIGGSLTVVGNSITHFVGELDQATGTSGKLASEILSASKVIDNSLPAALDGLRDHSDELSQALTTGLYVALGRVAGGYAALAPAGAARLIASAQEAKATLAAAAAATRKAEIDLVGAKNAIEQAALNRSLATSTAQVLLAENALSAAKAKALGLSTALAAARSAEAAANTLAANSSTATAVALGAMSRAASTLATAGRGVLALLGGPVGLAFVAGATALSFVDFSGKSKTLMGDLSQLGQSVDQVRTEFKKLNEDQQRAQINTWKDKQLGAALAVEESYKDLKESIKASLVDVGNVDMVDPGKIAEQSRAYDSVIAKLDAAKASGQALSPILREAAASGQISPEQLKAWENQAGVVQDNIVVAGQINERLATQTDLLGQNTGATQQNNQAKAGFTTAGQQYLKTLLDQVGKLQDNNDAVKEANRFLAEHQELTEADRIAILSAANAKKSQMDLNKAEAAQARKSTSDIKSNQRVFETAQENYQRQIELLNTTADKQNNATEVEKLAFEVSSGKYATLSNQQKKTLEASAAELDLKKKLLKADEDRTKLLAFTANLNQENQTAKDGYDLDLAGLGQGDKYRERLKETLQIRQDFNKKMSDLQVQQNTGKIEKSLYDEQTQALQEALATRLVDQQDYYNELDKAQSNWMDGVNAAWENYADAAQNYSAIAGEFVSGTLKDLQGNLGNTFADIVEGQKSASDAVGDLVGNMAKSVINALADMAAQWLVYQAVQLVVGKTTQSSGYLALVANAQAMSFQAQLAAYASAAATPIIGPELAPAAALTAAAATAPMVAGVASAALSGMAHSGMGNIPQEGTWLLDGGERVVAPEQNRDLTNFLAKQTAGPESGGVGGQHIEFNPSIVVQAQPGVSDDDARKQGAAISDAMEQRMGQFLDREMRQGGRLWRRNG